MKVTPLGTGTAIPDGDRYQTSLAVEERDSAGPLLIDCGAGTIHRLVQAGHDPAAVDTLLLTHHHLDHVADVPSLLKARSMLDAPEFTVIGPPGTGEYLAPLLTVDRVGERVDLEIRECEGSPFALGGHEITTCETTHSAAGFAYRIDDAFTFSGDTEAAADVAAFADGSAVLLHDCAYVDETRSNHATPAALGRTLAGVDVERVYLTHLYPDAAAEAERMRRTVSEFVDAAVHVAADLDPIAIPDDG